MSTTLILAAGESQRWDGKLKQLMSIGNETIIGRIQRQVFARGGRPLTVTHKEELLDTKLCIVPDKRETVCDTLLSTAPLWNGQTRVLLGDVIYSKAAMDRIFTTYRNAGDLIVFGNEWEIYALSFYETRAEQVIRHLEIGAQFALGKLRYFYQSWCGLEIGTSQLEDRTLQWVQDLTRDVDTQHEYDEFIRSVVVAGKLDGV